VLTGHKDACIQTVQFKPAAEQTYSDNQSKLVQHSCVHTQRFTARRVSANRKTPYNHRATNQNSSFISVIIRHGTFAPMQRERNANHRIAQKIIMWLYKYWHVTEMREES